MLTEDVLVFAQQVTYTLHPTHRAMAVMELFFNFRFYIRLQVPSSPFLGFASVSCTHSKCASENAVAFYIEGWPRNGVSNCLAEPTGTLS